VIGQHRSSQRYGKRGRDDEEALTDAVIDLARTYGRYGYRRVWGLLSLQGWQVSLGRVERIWRREGLKVANRQPKRGQALAERRLLHPSSAKLAPSRLELRFCSGPHR
jgi:transposase InsO family protein